MSTFDYKENFLRLVQRCVMDLKELKGSRGIDPDNLIEPLHVAIVSFRDRMAREAIDRQPRIVHAYQRLNRLLDYHEPHYAKEHWFKELRGMVQEDQREVTITLETEKRIG